jgi:putative addiction module antidote
MKLEIKKIGNSTGLILPKELLARLGLEQGDEVFVTCEPDQSFKVARYDDKHAEVMRIAREVMREYRDALKELAK